MSSLRQVIGPQEDYGWSNDDTIIAPQEPTCYFYGKRDAYDNLKFPDCQNINPLFCSLCKKFLCDTCRADYPRRIAGMGYEMSQTIARGARQIFDGFL